MSLDGDLLRQAQQLARREPRRPRQASLRRAVSAAYYALFHLLIREATTALVSEPTLRDRFARAFEHGDMKQASRAFGNALPAALPALTGGLLIPPALQQVALTFVDLQEERHEADYNVSRVFGRVEVNDLVTRAQNAFQQWRTVRTDPVARVYLAALLLWKKWNR
jgi:hypothetical protein